jgi:hypothetical protein
MERGRNGSKEEGEICPASRGAQQGPTA